MPEDRTPRGFTQIEPPSGVTAPHGGRTARGILALRLRRVGALPLLLLALCLPAGAQTSYYVDAETGNDLSPTGSAAAPWRTLARLRQHYQAGPAGALRVAGDTVYLANTFREPLKIKTAAGLAPGVGCSIRQWPGRGQAIVRGDTLTDLTDWAYQGTPGVFELDLPVGTCHNVNNRTLPEGIVGVVVDWDVSVDALGRHYGHLQRAQSAGDCLVRPDSWWFSPAGTPGVDQDGSGTLRINLSKGYESEAELRAAAHVIGYIIGNENGIEIGTNRYSDRNYTQDFDPATVVRQFTIDGIWSYLWCDSGWRTQTSEGGSGIDVGGPAPGASEWTVAANSMGYGIRPADFVDCRIVRVKTVDNGYHGCMFVGQRNSGNFFEDSEIWAGHANMTTGGSSGGFYCSDVGLGNKNIFGCRARNIRTYKYTLLGRATETVGGRVYAIPIGVPFFERVTNSPTPPNPITVTACTAGNPTELTLSHAMPAPFSGSTTVWVRLTPPEGGAGMGGLAGADSVPAFEATRVDATHLRIAFDSTATGAAGLAVFPPYDGFISHTNETSNNRVLDVEYRDCVTIESGWQSARALCTGSAFGAGTLGPATPPADPKNYDTYPVRYTDCEARNIAYNHTSVDTSIAYRRCTFHLERHGAAGSPAGTEFGGTIGSGSGTATLLFEACEFVDHMGSQSERVLFQLHATNDTYLINCSVYGLGATPNIKWFFGWNSADAYLHARGCIFSFASEVGGTANHLVGSGIGWNVADFNQSKFDMQDCLYAKITAPAPAPGPDFAQWASAWNGEGIDQGTVNIGAMVPYADGGGASLALNASGERLRKYLPVHADLGINLVPYSGNYGAYQSSAPQRTRGKSADRRPQWAPR